MLYLVSTPIGNLKDITYRAIEILKSVDLILAEDTRHSKILLKEYGIHTPLESFHAHSNEQKLIRIMALLKEGKAIALISDAGTPLISDPGYRIVREALALNVKITPIPGASALLAAVVISGLPIDSFIFLGFLPIKKGRQTIFKRLSDEKLSTVFFEAPHRLIRTLKELTLYLETKRKIVICRELTKIHEEVFRGTLGEAFDYFGDKRIRGEIVVVVGGFDTESVEKVSSTSFSLNFIPAYRQAGSRTS